MNCSLPKLILSAALLTIWAGSAHSDNLKEHQSSAVTPHYLVEQQACAILVGGSVGSRFEDTKVANFWHALSAGISESLHDKLQQDQYRVVTLLIRPEENATVATLVLQAMAKHQCSRIIQLSNIVSQDEQGAFFRYDISLMQAQADAGKRPDERGTSVTMNSNYSRSYRYARTPEIFKSFQFDEFSLTVYTDLKASGALAPLYQASSVNGPREYQVSHILLANEAEAQRAAQRLKNGESFEKVAAEMSLDTGTKTHGGKINRWTKAKDFSANFGREVQNLNLNQFSTTPVKTEFGWHLIRIDAIR